MIETFGLTHIQLSVRNLETSIHFYQSLFGMQELRRLGVYTAMLHTPGSHEVFTLNAHPEQNQHAGTTGGIAHFGFRLSAERDMEAVAREVMEAGGTVLERGTRGPDKKETYLFVKDPDGYEVELFWLPLEH